MTRPLRLLLAVSIVWASAAPAVPAFAAGEFRSESAPAMPAGPAAPGMIAPGALPSLAPSAVMTDLQTPGVENGAAAVAPSFEASGLETPSAAPVALDGGTVLGLVSAAAREDETSSAPRSIVGRLTAAVARGLSWTKVFDASASAGAPAGALSLRHGPLSKPVLPGNIVLGDAPQAPKPQQVGGVELNSFDFGDNVAPTPRSAGGVFDAGPLVLQADPANAQDVERALRAMVDADVSRYGVTSKELKTVHVKRVPGQGDQADTIFAYFNQVKNSKNVDGSVQPITIQGSYLSFTVKVVKGQPTLMSAMAGLYPNIQVDTTARATDQQLKEHALQVLNVPQNAGIDFVFTQRTIVFHDGKWKTVNLYDITGTPKAVGVKIAVDVATGEVFAWDARHGLRSAPRSAATVTVQGRGEAHEHRDQGKPNVAALPLPRLDVTIDGKKYTTDENGAVAVDVNGTAALNASLSGSWAQILDQSNRPISIAGTVKPGTANVVMANPTGNDLFALNQINMYVWITKIHDWWSTRLHGDARIDRRLPVNVNIDDECNAYYTPGTPSLNFFRESANCSDTGRPGVGAHEYGHFVDDMIGGIVDGGLSEGWGDIGSMFLLGSPIIGDGFLKNQTPNYIRHGENKYQYSASDEVHDQGQAWMGFAWKLRKALIAKLGDELKGAAEAEALIVPTLFTKAHDVPSQMAQVLLNAMDKDGRIKHEKEIRAAAKAHGIDLPANPRGVIGMPIASVSWEQPTAGNRLLSTITLGLVEAKPKLVVSGAATDVAALKESVQEWMKYRSDTYSDLSVKLADWNQSGTAASLSLEVEGSAASVAHLTEQIRRMAGHQPTDATPRSKPVLSGPMTLRAEDAPAARQGGVPLWGVVEVTNGGKDIAKDAQGLVSAHAWSTGWFWWKRSFVTYMINASPDQAEAFKAAGFKPLTEVRVRLHWNRVSDINGWGTEVNGEVTRRAWQDLTFSGEALQKGFALLRAFEDDPLAVLKDYPEHDFIMAQAGAPNAFERGFRVSSSIEFITGRPEAGNESVLFSSSQRSGYYR